MSSLVIPAKAGIQPDSKPGTAAAWIAAFDGATGQVRVVA